MTENAETRLTEYPKVSIGLPVYNGEQVIRKRLESLMRQSYSNFELIISDNASTDTTSSTCQEYVKKDPRIRFFQQKKNMGGMWNFNFVLKEAKCEYFVWASADDLWHPEFIQKNMEILIKKKEFVGSVTKEKFLISKDYHSHSRIRRYLRKKIISRRPNLFPIRGSYYRKVRSVLKSKPSNIMYGVVRTNALRKSVTEERFQGDEWSYILNIIRFGDFYEIEKFMLYRTEHGISWDGILKTSRKFNNNFYGIIFPNYPLTAWCAKNLGKKVFLKNLDQFILFNLEGMLAILFEVFLIIKNKLFGNES